MLAVEGLSKRFGGFLAVNQVSFEARQGEILGLIGPNGSGKSTTFNLIAGALAPTTGSIRFEGAEISGLSAHTICHKGIARTFQAGERIHTEDSYKYAPDEFAALLERAGFADVRCWQEETREFAVYYAA